jgi:hypothetical protein
MTLAEADFFKHYPYGFAKAGAIPALAAVLLCLYNAR